MSEVYDKVTRLRRFRWNYPDLTLPCPTSASGSLADFRANLKLFAIVLVNPERCLDEDLHTPPVTQYAKSGDIHVAYQAFGEGPVNLVMVPGFVSNIENYSDEPDFARFLTRLASYARVMIFDKREQVCRIELPNFLASINAWMISELLWMPLAWKTRRYWAFRKAHHYPYYSPPPTLSVATLWCCRLHRDCVYARGSALARSRKTSRHNSTKPDVRGREVKTTGDGFLATFDGPARAVRCACAIIEEIKPLGIEIRAGLHTGQCEMMDDDVGGIAVYIGARIAGLAGAGKVLVSRTVKDLVAGFGLRFGDRGAQVLKGVPGEWSVFKADR